MRITVLSMLFAHLVSCDIGNASFGLKSLSPESPVYIARDSMDIVHCGQSSADDEEEWRCRKAAEAKQVQEREARACIEASIPVLMMDGTTKRAGDVVVGDKLRGHLGEENTVLGTVWTDLVETTLAGFNDEPVFATLGHLWHNPNTGGYHAINNREEHGLSWCERDKLKIGSQVTHYRDGVWTNVTVFNFRLETPATASVVALITSSRSGMSSFIANGFVSGESMIPPNAVAGVALLYRLVALQLEKQMSQSPIPVKRFDKKIAPALDQLLRQVSADFRPQVPGTTNYQEEWRELLESYAQEVAEGKMMMDGRLGHVNVRLIFPGCLRFDWLQYIHPKDAAILVGQIEQVLVPSMMKLLTE